MPTYEYGCSSCEHNFTKLLKMAERTQPESQPCPECGTENSITQQIINPPGFGNAIRMGVRKNDSGFKEVMEKIHTGVPGSKLKNKDSSIF